MLNVAIRQIPTFKKAYKKLHLNQKQQVDDAIKTIVANPKLGEEKKGDLSGVFVYKFKVYQQETLLAYKWCNNERLLSALGTHENS